MKLRWRRTAHTRTRREWTPRREAAAKRWLAKEADKMALFPELRRETTVEQRRKGAEDREDTMTTAMRAHHAQMWREARAALRRMEPPARAAFLAYWNAGQFPAEGAMLLSFLRMKKLYIEPTAT
ncbi:MAG: hypothetical protein ACO1TE_14235 [Prosthecobacter sp.]